jgi:exodeoxyribonuclease V alpha subunit
MSRHRDIESPAPGRPSGAAASPALRDDADAAAQRLAAGFEAQVRRWAVQHGAPPESVDAAARAAAAASLATAGGHTCALLHEAFAETGPDVARARLAASGVVTTPARREPMPLVLDDDGRLYLHRYFEHERRLAERLRHAARTPWIAPPAGAAERLAAHFPTRGGRAGDREPDRQRLAAALAIGRRLTVISGGPGTGKTTTVVGLLACLVELQPGCRIALAAPTGKAAARMVEALAERSATLPEAVRAKLPTQALTVHRLLGATRDGGFRHDAAHPLPIDVLVVDEASMLDLSLAARLLDAVPDGARIVLLGDKDQLAAVEAGAVFAEISADPSIDVATREALAGLIGGDAAALDLPRPSGDAPLAGTTVWLTRAWRFAEGSGIGDLAAAIRSGDAGAVVSQLRAPGDGAVRWLPDDDAPAACAREGYAAFVDALGARRIDAAAAMRAFDGFRLLCAVRDGPRGVHALNRVCEQMVRAAVGGGTSAWYAGRAVMVTRNDPSLNLFNGDVGVALPDADGALHVHFPDGDGGVRPLPPARLPEHETAFAITVHKSQGSEFDRVAVVLPDRRGPVLTRELLYTACTRARRQVSLCASASVVEHAVGTPTSRRSGLLARLREA